MQNEIFEAVTKFNKTSFETIKQLMEINARAITKLTEKQMSIATAWVNQGIEQMEIAHDVKDPTTYMNKQTKMLKSYGDEAMTASKSMLDILTKTGEEISNCLEGSMNTITKATETTLKSVAKKAA